ncbi:hypothetical protein [Rhodobium gokarnense]|uniref:Peptidoglycan binding-like domain-containing protein n=1 Tax=Rhodobium gokarnense TaxID=364296 RepID=A0ABT3HHE4_9HYPH|nr:hypothetical protein [Rhodobium gokarnense]MCW2309800.1 hypothetical protein [Rhodobium gokarnense]
MNKLHAAKAAAAAAMAWLAFASSNASAQETRLSTGDAVVTRFSGLENGGEGPAIDSGGTTVELINVRSPGRPPTGQVWRDAPTSVLARALDVGQVFGIAIDDGAQPTIYVSATSAFGLHLKSDGSWLDGQWGPQGAAGTIYRISPENDYIPEAFTEIAPNDRYNTGAALGNLAYDADHKQLFVTDLESGLIHRVSAETGDITGTFDHGVDGRSYFLDVASGDYHVLPVVEFDPETEAQLDNCQTPDGATADASTTPSCWNVADYRRRVYGLAVDRDEQSGRARLYYTVWGADPIGDETWAEAGEDSRNTVWSIGISASGDFDVQDIRREFVLPNFFASDRRPEGDDGEGGDNAGEGGNDADPATLKPNGAPSDIAISRDGVMLVAERGGLVPDGAGPGLFAQPKMSRVLRYLRDDEGIWQPDARYNVGNTERGEEDGPPFIRANANGGVAFGFGYTDAGELDPEAPDAFVWATGDNLCSPDGPCSGNESDETNGLEGVPIDGGTEILAPEALNPPADGASATPPDGVDSAYIVPGNLADEPPQRTAFRVSHPGDVEVVVGGGETEEEIAYDDALPRDPEIPEGDESTEFDLAISKTGPVECLPGEGCAFEVTVTNSGSGPFQGPLFLYDELSLSSVSLSGDVGEPWSCEQIDGMVFCDAPDITLAVSESITLEIAIDLPAEPPARSLLNCIEVGWLGREYRTRIRFLQRALRDRGQDLSAIDGVYGPETNAAIEAVKQELGLPVDTEITDELLEALFGSVSGFDGDENPVNDRDCHRVAIPGETPTDHWRALSAFHRRFVSERHDQADTEFIDTHEPALSNFHRRFRSIRHDGTTTAPIPWHRRGLSRFHRRFRSASHDGRITRFIPVHDEALSSFHEDYRSVQHDRITTDPIDEHDRGFSRFHRRWDSDRHDGIVTRLVPIHRRALSRFHEDFRSSRHDGIFTDAVSIHNPGISAFHFAYRSGLHDRNLTRLGPGHWRRISRLHRRWESGWHNRWNSVVRPGHGPRVSSFHGGRRSHWHNWRTSTGRPGHLRGPSRFHRNYRSIYHARGRSIGRPIHGAGRSRFHRRFQSAGHNRRRSVWRGQHRPRVSRGNIRPGHNVRRSRGRDGQHNVRRSRRQNQQHSVRRSRGQNQQHNVNRSRRRDGHNVNRSRRQNQGHNVNRSRRRDGHNVNRSRRRDGQHNVNRSRRRDGQHNANRSRRQNQQHNVNRSRRRDGQHNVNRSRRRDGARQQNQRHNVNRSRRRDANRQQNQRHNVNRSRRRDANRQQNQRHNVNRSRRRDANRQQNQRHNVNRSRRRDGAQHNARQSRRRDDANVNRRQRQQQQRQRQQQRRARQQRQRQQQQRARQQRQGQQQQRARQQRQRQQQQRARQQRQRQQQQRARQQRQRQQQQRARQQRQRQQQQRARQQRQRQQQQRARQQRQRQQQQRARQQRQRQQQQRARQQRQRQQQQRARQQRQRQQQQRARQQRQRQQQQRARQQRQRQQQQRARQQRQRQQQQRRRQHNQRRSQRN